MTARKIAHPSVDDRKAMGFGARERAPLSSHTEWSPAKQTDGTRRARVIPR